MNIQDPQGKSRETSTLHKELQAPEESWEEERWSSQGGAHQWTV